MKKWKNLPQKLLIIGPIYVFQYCQPAQNQPKSQFLFHEICSPRDLCIMTVNTGKEWKKFSAFIKAYEGHFESFFQCVLQFYIILTRADREPSNIQILTVGISLIMVVVSGMNGYFRLIHLNHQINTWTILHYKLFWLQDL